MRSFIVVSLAWIVGCSAAPTDPISEDAGKAHVLPAGDAGADASDAAKADAHVEASAPKAPHCPDVPEDESAYQHETIKPARPYSASCGAGLVSYFYAQCLGPYATQSSCNTFQSSWAACAACLMSDSTDSAWGPIVSFPNYAETNMAGCVELHTANPAPSGSCADVLYQEEQCVRDACVGLCPLSPNDSVELDNFVQCETNATAGTCKSLDDAANTACQEDAGPYANCFVQKDFESAFIAIAPTFCGGS